MKARRLSLTLTLAAASLLTACSALHDPVESTRAAEPARVAAAPAPARVEAVSGRDVQAEVYADMPADDPWLEIGQNHLFAQIWTRPGLTTKERRWISLSLAAAAGSKLGYAAHLRGALESGDISEAELWEWLIHFTQYAGYPKAAPVWSEYRRLLAERGSMPLPSRGVETPPPEARDTGTGSD